MIFQIDISLNTSYTQEINIKKITQFSCQRCDMSEWDDEDWEDEEESWEDEPDEW